MPGTASEAREATVPLSLMRRLAALEGGPVVPREAKAAIARDLAERSRRDVARTYFGLGFAASCVLGCVALLPVLFTYPAQTRHAAKALERAHVARTAASGSAVATLELPVNRSERDSAPFPLRVIGANAAEAIKVTLRDVPVSALLSSGERQDEHTWSLQLSDLADLRLSLGDGTPDAFDMKIEVASSVEARVARSVARVRLVDEPPSMTTGSIDQALQRGAERGVDTPFRTETVPATRLAQVQQRPVQRPAVAQQPQDARSKPVLAEASLPPPTGQVRSSRPEGMSNLGALPREPAPEGRQVWWKMPPPPWSPFEPASGRH
ncbi:MAG: hypothetical protein F9K29_13910 [Hyphomicrobiaceae bacterium]|nr:MAG: hypothetical protein F9K29_13910 [Hyphomicrobiaceae bacterium]